MQSTPKHLTPKNIKSAKITISEFEEMVQASLKFMDENPVEVQVAEVMRHDVNRIRMAIGLLKDAYL